MILEIVWWEYIIIVVGIILGLFFSKAIQIAGDMKKYKAMSELTNDLFKINEKIKKGVDKK